MHSSRSHDAVIRVYDAAGNVIEAHEHKGEFKELLFCAAQRIGLVKLTLIRPADVLFRPVSEGGEGWRA